MSLIDLSSCLEAIDRLCAQVSLQRQLGLPQLNETADPPAGTTLWSSNYAILLLWPVDSNQPLAIERAAEEGEGWLDAVLSRSEEGQTLPLDGYLVLAIPSKPSASSNFSINQIELSSRICRKHVIWRSSEEAIASGAEAWARISDITVLGFPSSSRAVSDSLYWPDLGESAGALWGELQENSPTSVAKLDAEAPLPPRTQS